MSRLQALIQYLFVSLAVIFPVLLDAQTSSTSTFTTINLNNTVLQSPVKRLGMNLGQANFYDSGQMMKNLIVSNPGFEGGISQSMIQCGGGTATSCTDSISYSGWPADYWNGATYTIVYGTAIGRSGTITTFTPANNNNGNNIAAVFNFADSGVAPSSGDYMIVRKVQPGNAVDGWNYTLGSNGKVSTDTTDLPPDTLGKQALVLTAPAAGDSATITYYFDSTAGHTFLQLNGNYNLSFKAKAVSGSGSLYVALKRLSNPTPVYVYQGPLQLTNQWQTYNFPFTASENGLVGTVELDFATSVPGQALASNTVELDDTSLVQLNTDPTNTTVFRDPVVNTLKQLNPGVIRFWFNQLGETLDNLLAPQLGRQRSAYSAFNPDVNYIEYGLAEFLQLCQTVGTGSSSAPEPWIVLPITLSDAEASNIIDYLAGPTTTVYGAKRAAAGQTAPWTTVFPKIHLEFGNEAWNNLFYGGNMASPQAYGTRGQNVFAIMRNNANYKAASFDLMLNGTAYNPGGGAAIQSYCNNNDTFAAQPYLILGADDPNASGLTGAAAIENLFGPTFAEPEAFVTNSGTAEGIGNGLVLQNIAAAQSSGRPVDFAVTETNISPYNGSISQAELNGYVSSLGGGLAVIDSMLQNMRMGVLTQNIFELPEYLYYRQDGKAMYLFGSVVDMGVTNLKRPQFLAEEVANNAIGVNTTMLQTVHTGLDPTWNQAYQNSVQLNNAHYLQSFAFTSGDNYSLIIFNTNRSASEQVNFSGANIPGGNVQMTVLTSANITDTNETSSVVAPVTSTLPNFNAAAGMTLPPFSMTVLTWNAPAISNVTVTNMTSTSATVSWTVDDATSVSVVNYGTTTAYGSQSATTPAGTTQSVTLTGLTAGTTYNFAVTATNGAGATSSSGNFTFGTTASFIVSVPASVSLAQGQNGSVPVLVSDTNGYTGAVTLSVTGLPAAAGGTFQSTSGSASLALTVPSTVLAGTYPLTITGTAGSTVVTAPLSLIISGASQSQTITFNTIPSQYVGATVTAVATASSGMPVTFSVVQNGNCSVSGSTVKFLNVGNCGITASQAGNGTYEPVSVGQIVVVNSVLPPQTITFNAIADQTVGSTLNLSATASSGLAVSFSSSTAGTCTVSGSTALMKATGTCTITASQTGSSKYAAAPNVPQSFNVLGQTQTITFPTIATQTAGNTITLAATASSGLSVSFASTTPSVCSVSSTTLTLNTAGNCTIIASQAGNNSYAAAATVQQTFTVNAAIQAQTITFPAIAAQNVGMPLALSASASSNLAVSFSSTTPAVCTVSGSTATFSATGTCTITASQAGNSSYSAATPVSQSFTVNAALKAQTITFGAIAAQYVGTPLTLSASASSGLTVSFASVTPGICTVSGASAQFSAQGTCTIVASQAGNSTYAAAAPVSQNITVNPTAYTQTITFGAIATQTVGTPLALTATSTSQLAVSFASTTPSVCTVSGTTATFAGAGMCSITASQAGNNAYQAATPVTQSFSVTAGTQTITFVRIAAQTVGTPLTLSASASSGLTVSFASTTSSVCSVSGATATFNGTGTCSITASQAGNSSYAAATPVTQSFTVNAALQAQSITFGTIAAQTVGTPLTLTATASSSLAVTYTSSTTGVCTVSGSTATFVTPGTCSITASQAGNTTYSAATPVTQSFAVNAAPKAQTITFGSITAQQVGTPLNLNASASSGLPVSYASNSAAVCTVSGTTATFVTSGTCTITASQAGSSAYLAATPATQSFLVNAEGQVITFSPMATQQAGTSLILSATASSGLPVSFGSATPLVCAVSGSTATLLGAGTCGITASQPGNSAYAAATPVTQSFTVQGAASIITATPVSLGSAANIYGIFNNGSTITNGGLDTASYAYSANLLGKSLTFQGIPYSFGTAGTANAASATTITLPPGSYSALSFLGTAIYGPEPSQVFTVTYTDGTASTFTQSMSDWGAPQNYSGETVASAMAYRLTPSGTQATGQTWNLYAYSFALDSTRTVKSLTLPNLRNVTVAAVTLSTSQAAQTITFGTIAAQTAGTPLTLSATASSGLAVSYASSTTSVCTVSDSTASFAAAGTCTITASQTGNSTYAPATPVSQSFTVNSVLKSQSITFGSVATQTVGTPLTLSATASSGLTVTYASSSSICSVSGSTASFVAAGTCTITASQTGNSTYAAATPVSQSFTVQAAATTRGSTTTVSLGSAANVYGIFNNGSTVTNGGLDTSSYAYSASLLGTGLTFQGIPYSFGTAGSANAASSSTIALPAGSYSSLNFVGTAIYGPEPSQTFTVTYTDGTTSTFTQSLSDWSAPQSYAGETVASTMAYRLTPNGSQSTGQNWYLYSYSFALNSAKTVKSFTLPGVRNVVVVAVTLSSTQTTQTAQTITFGTIAAQTVGTPLTLSATASSGLAVTYASSTTSICTVSGSTATFVAAGTCTLTASQGGNATYAAATSVSQSFTVNAAASTGMRFIPVTPFRAVDTRNSAVLASGTSRSFTISGSGGIPASALAYSLNVTVVPSGTLQSLTVYPTGGTQPSFPMLSSDGRVKAQAAIIQAGTSGAITVAASNQTQVIVDVNGYFVPASNSAGLTFYPVTPTRLFDTRTGTAMAGGSTRSFAIQSTAGIPATAQAYSLNMTAVPSGTVGNLSVWPAGQSQTTTSTLNPGTNITANAAIVGAGTNGSISVYAAGTTNLIIDINGYWAPAGTGGLSLYPVTPVRTYDSGTTDVSGTVTIPAPAASAGVPAGVSALLLNAMVTPPSSLGDIVLWAAGTAQPNVSTLNAVDGAVTSNLAIVGTTNGSVNAFVTSSTVLTIDVYGYFAQ